MKPNMVYLMVGVLICALVWGSQTADAQVSSKKVKREAGELFFRGKLKPLKGTRFSKAKIVDRGITEILGQSKSGDEWHNDIKSNFLYSEDRSVITEQINTYSDGHWEHHQNSIYTFREDGRLSSYVLEYVDGTLSYRFEMFYNTQGRLDSIKYEEPGYGTDLTELVYHTPDSITFIYDGVPDESSYMVMKDGNLYEIYSSEGYIDRYIYYGADLDEYIRQLSDVFYFVDIYNDELYDEEEGFIPYSRIIHQKTEGRVTQKTEEYYDKENEIWNPQYRTDYVYEGGVIVSDIMKFYYDNWTDEYRSLYSYESAVSNEREEVFKGFMLHQNYPNPFNPSTTISFTLQKPENVEIKVFDILGKEVVQVFSGNKPAGTHSVSFNALSLPSGVYYYQLVTDNFRQIRAMTLLK